jgi:hypothetical protein
MKNLPILFFAATLFLIACNTSPNPFLITKHSVGKLNDSTKVKDLKRVFEADSLSQFIDGDEFTGKTNIIKVFEKGTQKLLLELTPREALDSLSTIQNIRIMDNRFKTQHNINKTSTFEVISSKYTVSSTQNTLRNLIVSIDEENIYFTIDKSELPEDLRYDMNKKIEAVSIPPSAKIRDFFIQWY